ncbi:MAG: MOSC domain-containing protein [Armatimonadota bacterium]
MTDAPTIISLNISPGGIPKLPVDQVYVTVDKLEGDGRAHARHATPDRAVSLIDDETLQQLRDEGYAVSPGAMGENLTVRNLHVQTLTPRTRLRIDGGVVIELVEPRKPCFVLDAIHPDLKTAVTGRCGYLAKVITEGTIRSGATLAVEE